MRTILIITGTSTGIGKAVTQKFLNERVVIHGIGRKCTIKHHNYHHHEIDLRDLTAVLTFPFPDKENFERIILINNAGMIGDIKPVGRAGDLSFAETFQVNLTAPVLLVNRFLAEYKNTGPELIIINISSGAARNPIPSWSAYCASKAGLEMFSQVVAVENRTDKIRIHSVSPGIVETPMQEQIRSTPPEEFERVGDFIGYYKNKELVPPAMVADQVWKLIHDPEKENEVVISFRQYM